MAVLVGAGKGDDRRGKAKVLGRMTAWKDKGLKPALFHHAIAIGAGIVVRPSAVYYGSACFYGARAAAFIFSI